MKKLVKIISLVLCFSLIIVNTGCIGKKKKKTDEAAEAQEQVSYEDQVRAEIEAEYTEQLSDKEKELENIKSQLALYDGKYKSSEAFTKKSILQAGSLAFVKVNDKIVLDKKIIKDTFASVAGIDSCIEMGKFTINPSNWVVKLSGGKAYFSINNVAYGDITFYSPESKIKNPEDEMKSAITKFMENNQLEEISSRNICLSNKTIGYEAKSRIMIRDNTTNGFSQTIPALTILEEDQLASYGLDADADIPITIDIEEKETDAYLICGAFYTNNYIVVYNFISESENGNVLVENLINSIKSGTNAVYFSKD